MKTKVLAIATLATTLLASCSKNEDVAVNVLPEDGVIRVTAGVNDLATRAGVGDANLDKFGLYITNSNSGVPSRYTYKNIFMAKIPGGKWEPCETNTTTPLTTPLLWNKATEKVTVMAYYPHTENVTDTMFVHGKILSDQTLSDSDIPDLLWAKSDVTPSSPVPTNDIHYDEGLKSLNVKMNHKLSKLRVNIKYRTELNPNSTVSNMTLANTKIGYKFDLNNGKVSLGNGTNDPADIQMYRETPTTGFAATYEAILVPQGAQFSIKLTVEGVEYVYTYPEGNYNFESGKLYRLDLTIGKDVAPLNEMSSSEWGKGNESGEEVETE